MFFEKIFKTYGIELFVLNEFTITNQLNDINVNNKLRKKNKEINGKYSDWIGISDDILTDMIPIFKNVVKACKIILNIKKIKWLNYENIYLN